MNLEKKFNERPSKFNIGFLAVIFLIDTTFSSLAEAKEIALKVKTGCSIELSGKSRTFKFVGKLKILNPTNEFEKSLNKERINNITMITCSEKFSCTENTIWVDDSSSITDTHSEWYATLSDDDKYPDTAGTLEMNFEKKKALAKYVRKGSDKSVTTFELNLNTNKFFKKSEWANSADGTKDHLSYEGQCDLK